MNVFPMFYEKDFEWGFFLPLQEMITRTRSIPLLGCFSRVEMSTRDLNSLRRSEPPQHTYFSARDRPKSDCFPVYLSGSLQIERDSLVILIRSSGKPS
jgi:hypothetical protein